MYTLTQLLITIIVTYIIVIQWKFYSLAIRKLGVILFVDKLNADGEAPHLRRWGPILFLGFPRGFIPFFGVGESLKLADFGQQNFLIPSKNDGLSGENVVEQ